MTIWNKNHFLLDYQKFRKDSMNIFSLRKRFLILIISLILIMTFFQVLNKQTQKDPLTKSSYFLFSNIQTLNMNLKISISHFIGKYLFLLNRQEENAKLKKETQKLKVQHQQFEEILQENNRLKKLIVFPLKKKFQLLPAQILSTDFLSKNELLTINKGRSHGIKKFMGVLHPKGVVGYVFRVSQHSSQILSLLNPLSSLPARNQRSRIQGLIQAKQKNLLVFNHLYKPSTLHSKDQDLKVGDKIVVSKSDQFPAGFLIGTISSLDNSSKNLNPKAYVKPALNFYSLEEVFLVLNLNPPIEKTPTRIKTNKIRKNNETKK